MASEQPEVNATDGAVERARKLGVDLSEVEGSGEKGRVQAKDVEDHFAAKGAGDPTSGTEVGDDGETSPNTGEEDAQTHPDDGDDEPDEFDAEQSEKLSPRLAPHLTDTGLVILEENNPDDEEIATAIAREREKRDTIAEEEDNDAIDLLKKFARIMRRPMSRSQVARRSQRLLTRLGHDWREDR